MKKRLLITILLFSLFAAASAYVIILAQGYRLDNGGKVITTSILRINSIPQDVKVYINGQPTQKVENRVEGLTPGPTKVKLEREGYKSWEKTIILKGGIVEDLNAQLYPERLDFEKVTSSGIDKFYISNNSDYLFYTLLKSELTTNIGIWRIRLTRNILDFNDNEPEIIYSFDSDLIKKLSDYELTISPDSSKAFLNLPSQEELYLIDFNSKTLTDINSVVGFYPKKVSWFEGSSSAIFSTNQLITSFDINSKQVNLVYFSALGEPIYGVGNSAVYYYRKDLAQFFHYQNRSTNLLKVNNLEFQTAIPTQIHIAKDSDKILLVETQSNYFFLDLDKEFTYVSDVKGKLLKLSPNGKSYIERIDDLTLESSYFKDNLDKKTYSFAFNTIKVDQELEFLNYTDNSRNILFVLNSENREVWLSDFDGLNLFPVIQDELISSSKVLVSDNAVDIFVLLEDSSSSIDNSKTNNIYKFKLEVSN